MVRSERSEKRRNALGEKIDPQSGGGDGIWYVGWRYFQFLQLHLIFAFNVNVSTLLVTLSFSLWFTSFFSLSLWLLSYLILTHTAAFERPKLDDQSWSDGEPFRRSTWVNKDNNTAGTPY